MATLVIADSTPIAELDKLARAAGKRLRYQHPAKEIPHGHNRNAAGDQPVPGLADRQRNH